MDDEQRPGRILGDEHELRRVVDFIRDRFDLDLHYYRESFVFRHLRSKMSDVGAKTATDYICILKREPEEFSKFLETLSINVTHFFRDADVFESVRKLVIPEILKRKERLEQYTIRVWSAGCASGQEPYSLAILFKEALRDAGKDNFIVKIIATDIDAEAMSRAEIGEYAERDFRETDKKLLDKYFTPAYNSRYKVNDDIKRFVKFEKNNLISDGGYRNIDLIFCRNVLIYFNRKQQEFIFQKFHGSLNADGFFVIAKVETVWDKNIFVPVDLPRKIYKRAERSDVMIRTDKGG